MTSIERKIIAGSTITDSEMFKFFDIEELYNRVNAKNGLVFNAETDIDLHYLLSSLYHYYTYGGDEIFWIANNYYIDHVKFNEWFVDDVSYKDNEKADELAGHAIARYRSDDSEICVALSLFGLDDIATNYLDIVIGDFDGPCKIWIQRYYHSGHISNSQHSNYAVDESYNVAIYADAIEAQKWIDKRSDPYYLLSNGECSSPDYYITEA